jgi:hypothetical protein
MSKFILVPTSNRDEILISVASIDYIKRTGYTIFIAFDKGNGSATMHFTTQLEASDQMEYFNQLLNGN